MKTLFRLEVEWIDSGAARSDGWEPRQEMIDGLDISRAVVTVGVLLLEDEDRIILAQTADDSSDTFFSAFCIWKPSIKRVTILRAREDLTPGENGMFFPEGV